MKPELKSNLILIGLGILFGLFVYMLFDRNSNKQRVKELKETVKENQRLTKSQDSILNAFSVMNIQQQKETKHLMDTLKIISKNYNAKVDWYNKQNAKKMNELNSKIDSLKILFPEIPIIDKK